MLSRYFSLASKNAGDNGKRFLVLLIFLLADSECFLPLLPNPIFLAISIFDEECLSHAALSFFLVSSVIGGRDL